MKGTDLHLAHTEGYRPSFRRVQTFIYNTKGMCIDTLLKETFGLDFSEYFCLFYLSFNFGFYVSGTVRMWLGVFDANQATKCLGNQTGPGWSLVDRKQVGSPPVVLFMALPGRLFCFRSLVILDGGV